MLDGFFYIEFILKIKGDVQMSFIMNQGVSIHYLISQGNDKNKTPIIFLPGMLGCCEQYQDELIEFFPRKSIAISLRGNGQSDIPETGYSFLEHCSDIQAVIDACSLECFYLFAYSGSAPFAIHVAIQNKHKIKGLILCDYPAKVPSISKEWVEKNQKIHLNALRKELKSDNLVSKLYQLNCPVLLLKGAKRDSLLSAKDTKDYLEQIENCELLIFEESGHVLWEPDYDYFIRVIKDFMD